MKNILLTLLCWLLPLNVMATCNNAITKSTPSSRFNANGDGTATDKQTGLTWMRCSIGQTWHAGGCIGSPSAHNWQQALSLAKEHAFAGKKSWRLPNLKELNSIVEVSCVAPAINTELFPNTHNSSYWTSSPFSSNAWVIYSNGLSGVNHTNSNGNVRLVRSE